MLKRSSGTLESEDEDKEEEKADHDSLSNKRVRH